MPRAEIHMVRLTDSKVVGVIDLGSNSVRMNIVQINPDGSTDLLTQEREMVQLGQGAFLDNELKQDAMQRTADVLKMFADICKEYNTDECLAVATSAVRDAKNGRDFLNRLTEQTGISFYSISGVEEARLIYKGVSQDFPVSDTLRFYLDVGGGSTEFIVGDSYMYRELDSVKIGCVRMANMFMQDKHGTVSEQEYRQMQNYVRLEASHTLGRMSSYVLEQMVVSSGTVQCLLNFARGFEEEHLIEENFLSYKSLCKVVRLLCSKTEEERRNISGMHPKRANIIIPGAAILQTVMEELGFSGCYVSSCGLREGILRDYLEKNFPHAKVQNNTFIQERSVFKLAKACKFEEQHAKHIAFLTLRLFDNAKLLGIHDFSEKDRHMLYYAGILHDIGIIIAFTGHDEHGYYIVKNYAGLLGFTEERQTELALLVGSHRMKENSLLNANRDICQHRKKELALLSCFLKLAESLDRSHDQYVEDAYFEYDGDELNLCVISAVPECVEQGKLAEGIPVLRSVLPQFNAIIWKSNK